MSTWFLFAILVATLISAAAWFGEIILLREELAKCIAPKRIRAKPGLLWVIIFCVIIATEIVVFKMH
ncbi:MAG: hypothetical protein JW841_10590 [Deltaproteobacteria bacterium]|nr:hypothetical protein [Deltaproteobacteria bacterium]